MTRACIRSSNIGAIGICTARTWAGALILGWNHKFVLLYLDMLYSKIILFYGHKILWFNDDEYDCEHLNSWIFKLKHNY